METQDAFKADQIIRRLVLALLFLTALVTPAAILYSRPPEPQHAPAVVRNGAKGKWDDAPRIKLSFVDMLGKEEDENSLFYKPNAIASDRKGNLYVLDAGNSRIQVFTPAREFLRSFGRKGQGPGELGRPECLDVDAAGNVYVGDSGNGRISVFNPRGKWLRSIAVPAVNIVFRLMNNGDILLRNPNLESGIGLNKGDVPLFLVLDGNGRRKRDFGQGVHFTKFPEATGGNRALIASDDGDNAYLAFLFQNQIRKYSPDGTLVYSADRLLPKERRTKSSQGIDLYYTINEAIAVDSRGRVWVATFRRMWGSSDPIMGPWIDLTVKRTVDRTNPKTDLYEIQVFAPDGVLLQKIPLTHFCDYLEIVGDTVYILDKNRLGQFYVYRIEEAEGASAISTRD